MKCETCGMERGEHDRACIQEQLHAQKLRIIKQLGAVKRKHGDGDFMDRLINSTMDHVMKIVREA